MRLFLGVIIFCWSGFSLAGDIEVTVQLHESSQISSSAKRVIEEAAKVAFQRIAKFSVANCAYRNSEKSGTADQLRQRWSKQIPNLNKSRKVTIAITAKDLGDRTLGTAQVGTATIDKNWYRLQNLAINLNADMIHGHLKANRDQTKLPIDIWVNTIAHEVAHNFGYRHGTSGNWARDYPGYFPTELGYCVMTDGRHGSDMGDPKKRRNR